MNAAVRLDQLLAAARRRRFATLCAVGLPLVLAAALVTLRVADARVAVGVAIVATVLLLACTVYALRLRNRSWLARRIDAAQPAFEDSAALLNLPVDAGTPLQRLQRTRLEERVERITTATVHEPWPRRTMLLSLAIGAVISMAAMLWPQPATTLIATAERSSTGPAAPTDTRIVGTRLTVQPPAYTGLPRRDEVDMDIEVPEQASVTWQLRFNTAPSTATLNFHDGTRLDLALSDGVWMATRRIDRAALYRVEVTGAPAMLDARLHRLDVIADRAPEVRVIEPDRTLTVLERAQAQWSLAFEVSDDYGVVDARLAVTLAQGDGENVEVSERTVVLQPQSGTDARERRYRHALALNALGFAAGDDAIVRLSVRDNREPQANTTRSASFILRWPAPKSGESTGMDGLVQKIMPAYFRSQRQIIIDTEALIAEKHRISADDFLARADTLGVDQKILRLRYGQFLGEEFESHTGPAGARAEPAGDGSKHDDQPAQQADALADDHDHDQPAASAVFGAGVDTLHEFGHAHDLAEAATLLDEETKKLLRAALSNMWDAELNLRTGAAAAALPFENNALRYIKLVQQATRIYLSRVGLELPAIDPARRLTGDRSGMRDRDTALTAATAGDLTAEVVWREIVDGDTPDLDALTRWVRARDAKLPDALGLLAAIDAVQRDNACVECRARLQQALWPLLRAPAPALNLRTTPNDEGRAYLEQLPRDPAP